MRLIVKNILFVFSILLILPFKTVFAEGNFADVNLIFPKYQNENVSSYYDIKVDPGQKVKLNFIVSNFSNKKQKFSIKSANAFTSANASDISLSNAKSFPYSKIINKEHYVSEWIDIPDGFTLEPFQNKTVSIEVTIPNDASGQYLGGFLVINDSKNTEKTTNNSNVTLNQKFERGISILLNVGDLPKDKLTIDDAYFKLENNKKVIELNITNPINKISQLYKPTLILKQDSKVIGKFNINNLKFSPQTSITYSYDISKYDFKYDKNITIELQGYYDEDKLRPMKYQSLKLEPKHSENETNTENFIEKNFFNQETTESNYTLYFILLTVILVIVTFIIKKQRTKIEKNKESNDKS